MIERIKIGIDMLDEAQPLNPGENERGVKILCATNTVGRSEDRRSVSWQIENRFGQAFKSNTPGYVRPVGEVFHTDSFNFGHKVQAKAHAIVCHLGGDMKDQNYSEAMTGLSRGLATIYSEYNLNPNEQDKILKAYEDEVDRLKGGCDIILRDHERLIRNTRLKLNPLMRIPLLASESPEDCARLFEVMQDSRANLVVYMLSPAREIVEATIIKFPKLKQLIPALADEELKLAA